MTKKILVTGASGFVGQHVLGVLEEEDVELHLVLRDAHRQLVSTPNVKRITTTPDLFSESEDWWEGVLQGVDTIVHLAWYVEPGHYLDSPRNLDCLIGSVNLGRAAAKAKVRRFIGVGTCFEYDLSPGFLSVETPLNPLTLYAASKTALFMTLSQWFQHHNTEFAWGRLFYLYGDGEDKRRFVPYVRSQLEAGLTADLGSGDQVRDFINVEKAAEILSQIILGEHRGPINVCSGVPTTIKDFAEKIAAESGRTDLLNFGARSNESFDPAFIVGIPNHTKALGESP